jgi:hypothetical protein
MTDRRPIADSKQRMMQLLDAATKKRPTTTREVVVVVRVGRARLLPN